MSRTLRLAALAASMLALPFAAQAQDKWGDKPLKIGVLSDFSSMYANYAGDNALASWRFAVQDFLDKHPNRKVEIVFADHLNKPDVASAIVRKWYDQENVDMVGSIAASAPALAVQLIGKERNKLTVVSSASSSAILGEQCTGMTVQWPYNSRVMGDSSIKALMSEGNDSWFFVTMDNAGGDAYQNDATDTITKAGNKVAGSVRHPFGNLDFSSYILRAQQSGAKVIAMANSGPDTVNTIKAAADFGLMQKQKLVGLGMSLQDIHAVTLQVAQGLYFGDGWYWDLNDDTRAYGRRFFAERKQMPSNAMASDYSAALTYLNAADAVDSKDAKTVLAQLKKTKVNDMYTKDGYVREDGQMIHTYYLFQAKKPSESKYAWDYLNLVKSIPGDVAYQPLSESKCPMFKKS